MFLVWRCCIPLVLVKSSSYFLNEVLATLLFRIVRPIKVAYKVMFFAFTQLRSSQKHSVLTR